MDEQTQDLSAWAHQRARYSRARRGRNERGASLAECAMVEAVAQAIGQRAQQAGAVAARLMAPPALPAG